MKGVLLLHLGMICSGLGVVVWGLPAAHRLNPPWDAAAAVAVLAGVLLALLGTLLVAVPGFFAG
jgi:hypothetical protein